MMFCIIRGFVYIECSSLLASLIVSPFTCVVVILDIVRSTVMLLLPFERFCLPQH